MKWTEWIDRHLALFGMESQEGDLLTLWAELFARAGHAPADLVVASERLVLKGAPRYRTDMLHALQESLAQVSAERQALARAEAMASRPVEGASPCDLCDGTGRVIVPRLGGAKPGTFGTVAVLCRCPLGRWFLERQRSRRPMTLDEYEQHSPDWREEVRRQEQVRRLAVNARSTACSLDRVRGELAARTRLPR